MSSPSLRPLQPGETFADYFVVERRLKAGGMGAVYVVTHRETGKRLALKVMHPEIVADEQARARFKQEAQISSRIDLPKHIVDVQHAGVDNATGMPFIVMELLQGSELGELVRKRGRLPPSEVVDYLTQTAKALDRAHDKNVVHRDLKPDNLFLCQREDEPPTIKILDFGIAKILQTAGGDTTFLGGTPTFMAPEQTMKGAKISAATDVWALGLIAYQLLVGKSYWETSSVPELLRAILIDDLPQPTIRAIGAGVILPPAFDAWMIRCIQREPSLRYQRASDATVDLARVFQGVTAEPPHTAPMLAAPVTLMGSDPETVAQTSAAAPSAFTPSAAVIAPPPRAQEPRLAARSNLKRWALPLGAALGVGALAAVISRPGAAPTQREAGARSAESSALGEQKPSATTLTATASAAVYVETNPFVPAASLLVQQHEVTRGEYALVWSKLPAVAQEAATPLDGAQGLSPGSKLPMTWVTYEQATAYCVALGARLPTSAEWTSLLDGTFPWGPAWKTAGVATGLSQRELTPVGSSPGDVTRAGVHDLGGNVQEWTATVEGGLAKVRGGAIGMADADAKRAITEGYSKFTASAAGDGAKREAIAGATVGFRCIRSR